MYFSLQYLNLSTTVTLGTAESGHCREVETRVKKMKKNGHCGEVAISGSSNVLLRVTRERNLASRMTHVCSV